MRSFDEILAKIAHDNGTTPEDVLPLRCSLTSRRTTH